MTLREKVGQLFMIGLAGTSVSRDLADLLAAYRRPVIDPLVEAAITGRIREAAGTASLARLPGAPG